MRTFQIQIFADADYKLKTVHLEKDDTFVFSDGLADAENDNMECLENERMTQAIQRITSGTGNFCNALVGWIDSPVSQQKQSVDLALLTVNISNCAKNEQEQAVMTIACKLMGSSINCFVVILKILSGRLIG